MVQPAMSRMGRIGGGRRAIRRMQSHAARSCLKSSSRRETQHHAPFVVGVMQIGTDIGVNDTCHVIRTDIMSGSEQSADFTRSPYCLHEAQEGCKICSGQTYFSSIAGNRIDCCHGVIGGDGICYMDHHRDVSGNVCHRSVYELDESGHCHLARPVEFFVEFTFKAAILMMFGFAFMYPFYLVIRW